MSRVIRFLETLGSNPALSTADYAASVAMLGLDDAQQEALLGRDHKALNELLEGRTTLRFVIATPDDVPVESPDDSDGDGVPDRDEPTPSQD